MKKTVLILDDMKVRHDAFDRIYDDCRVIHAWSYHDACDYITDGDADIVHLDHDLGDFLPFGKKPDTFVDGWGGTQEFTGYHAAMHICNLPDDKLPERVVIHSVNPVGAKRMLSALIRRGIPTTWEPFCESSHGVEE